MESIWDEIDVEINSGKKVIITEKNCYCEISNKIQSDGFLVCKNCGLVLENTILDESKESSNYLDNDGVGKINKDRTGMEMDNILPKNSMSSFIPGKSKLAILNYRMSFDYKENVLIQMKMFIKKITVENNWPDTLANETITFYKKIIDSGKIYRGTVKKGLIAVCFSNACKNNKISILTNTIINLFGINIRIYNKCIELFRIYNTQLNTQSNFDELLNMMCCKLNIPIKFQKICIKIIHVVNDLQLSQHCPQILITSVIQFVIQELGNNYPTLENICGVYKISENSIKDSLKLIQKNKILILNKAKSYT
jgi:transcription initiation factor TFIIIB Brf1 subunit/transcription initiation factor TFIIB